MSCLAAFRSFLVLPGLLAGCTLADIELDVDEVRLTSAEVELKGFNGAAAAKHRFAFTDLAAVSDLLDVGAEVAFVGAELRATSGVDDLSFVEQLTITLASGDDTAGLAPVTAYHCAGNCAAHARSLEMSQTRAIRATDYLATGSLALELDVEGHLPGRPWTVVFEATFTAHLDHRF